MTDEKENAQKAREQAQRLKDELKKIKEGKDKPVPGDDVDSDDDWVVPDDDVVPDPSKIDDSLTIGDVGEASTTRYWDCSGGACGCGFGDPGNPTHCHANAMFRAPSGNPYGAKFYGTAAISGALGGGDWLSDGCGRCFKLTGKANIDDHKEVSSIVLKAANYCPPSNAVCSGGRFHFDIAAPGFDYAGASNHNRCDSNQDEQALKHPQTCGYWMIHSQNADENCDCSQLVDSTLRKGCENFRSLNWDNPKVSYQQVKCPEELDRMPCWSGSWPSSPPQFCANPFA